MIDNNENENDIELDSELEFDNDTENETIYDDISDIELDTLTENDVVDEIEVEEKVNSKHKEKGKHALKYDTIFKGKKQESSDNEHIIELQQTFNADNETSNGLEQRDQFEYERLKKLRQEIYAVMHSMGKINIEIPRRKPSRVEFNRMYSRIVSELDMDQYSYSEAFAEYADNFSDNLENMFKMLDEVWGGKISSELIEKYKLDGNSNFEEMDFM
jgi:hypothetical protein